MRFSLLVVFVLAVGFVGTLKWHAQSAQDSGTIATNEVPAEHDHSIHASHPLLGQVAEAPSEEVQAAFSAKVHAHNHDHSDDPMAGNSATDFDALPAGMQTQIVQLSGRGEYTVQPVEVKPGLFMMPIAHGPKVVPVAVMNEDGSVSVYEY